MKVIIDVVAHDTVTLNRTFERLTRRENRLTRLIDSTERALGRARDEDLFTSGVYRLVSGAAAKRLRHVRRELLHVRNERASISKILDSVVHAQALLTGQAVSEIQKQARQA